MGESKATRWIVTSSLIFVILIIFCLDLVTAKEPSKKVAKKSMIQPVATLHKPPVHTKKKVIATHPLKKPAANVNKPASYTSRPTPKAHRPPKPGHRPSSKGHLAPAKAPVPTLPNRRSHLASPHGNKPKPKAHHQTFSKHRLRSHLPPNHSELKFSHVPKSKAGHSPLHPYTLQVSKVYIAKEKSEMNRVNSMSTPTEPTPFNIVSITNNTTLGNTNDNVTNFI